MDSLSRRSPSAASGTAMASTAHRAIVFHTTALPCLPSARTGGLPCLYPVRARGMRTRGPYSG
jgi:hypothetical protein